MAQLNGIVRGNTNDIATKETINENTAYNFQDIQGIGLTNEQMANALTTAQNGFFKKDSIWYCTDSGTYTKDHFYQFTITGTSPADNVASWTDLGALGGGGTELIVTQNADIASSDWDTVTGVDGYSYSADIEVEGAEASDVSIVTFNNTDADSGNFASVCDTDEDVVTIYAKQAQDVLIPSILTIKTGVEPIPPEPNPGLYTDSTYTTLATLPSSAGSYAGEDATWENIKLAYPGAFSGTSMICSTEVTNLSYFKDFSGYLRIGNEITTLGHHVFNECEDLIEVIIPNSVITMEKYVFRKCYGLTNLDIPNSVTSLGEYLCGWCTGLTTLRMGSGVTSIGNLTDGVILYQCDSLTSIIVDSDNPVYDSRDNCNAIIETATNKIIEGCISTTFPSTVTSIGEYAFASITTLTTITIPTTIINIAVRAFVKTGLTSITCLGTTPPTLGGYNAFAQTNLTAIYVPESSVDAYKEASQWSYYANIIQAIQE